MVSLTKAWESVGEYLWVFVKNGSSVLAGLCYKKKKKKADGYKAASPSSVCRSPCCAQRSPLFLSPNEYHSHIKRNALAKVAFRIWDFFFFPLHDQIPPKVAKPGVWTEGMKTIKFQQRPRDFQILKCCACVGCTASNGANKQLQFPLFAVFSKKGNALRANHLCNVNDGERVNL